MREIGRKAAGDFCLGKLNSLTTKPKRSIAKRSPSTHRVAPQALTRTVARGRACRSPERGNGRAVDLGPALD
jgi:hypothetical protein